MKRVLLYLFIVIGVISLLNACSSGKKAYQQGNYYESVMKSVERLRSKPDNKKAREALASSYPLAVSYFQNDAKNKLASNDPFKWSAVVYDYQMINRMYDEINRSPGALEVIQKPVSYFDELSDAKRRAADELYVAGLRSLDEGTRESAKEAYQFFVKSDEFEPGYKDVKNKIDESLDKATYKIILEQIPAITRYQVSSDFFQDQIESYLKNRIRNQFVKFYTPAEADVINVSDADQVLRMYFEDFVVGETHLVESRKEVTSKDSVKVGEVVLDDGSKVEAYNRVTADLTTYRKEIKSRGTMVMEILDANTTGLVHSDKFSGEYVWYSEWGNYNGDERALTSSQKKMVKRKEGYPPPNRDLFLEFTKPIYNQVTGSLNRYYSRF